MTNDGDPPSNSAEPPGSPDAAGPAAPDAGAVQPAVEAAMVEPAPFSYPPKAAEDADHFDPLGPITMARVVQAAPGVLRLAGLSGLHFAEWALKTSVGTSREMLQSMASGTMPTEAFRDATADIRRMGKAALVGETTERPARSSSEPVGATTEELQARGAQLLYRSADVWFTADIHPAFERILDELAPDEARILRFLATDGPQPSVDVRTGRPLGIGSELIAERLSMIGLHAGVRDLARSGAYENNLFRLGLIWFSREQVDPNRYQVIEVQPDVVAAIKQAGRMPRLVRHSIHLTPFGEDFCRTCLPIDADAYWTGSQPAR